MFSKEFRCFSFQGSYSRISENEVVTFNKTEAVTIKGSESVAAWRILLILFFLIVTQALKSPNELF